MTDPGAAGRLNRATMPAMAWDPKSPMSLRVPRLEEEPEEGQSGMVMATISSHPGVGCHHTELSALLRILTAHEAYHDHVRRIDLGEGQIGQRFEDQKALCRSYRAAVQDCLAEWNSLTNSNTNDNKATTPEEKKQEEENREVLDDFYNFMHLSDVFLPILPVGASWEDMFNVKGAVTADTVRYLRYNFLTKVELLHPDFDEMISSIQPEHFGTAHMMGNSNSNLYWDVLRALVLRGCLDQAWKLLSMHSLFMACVDPTQAWEKSDIASARDDVYEAFLEMRDILLRAPLPAGRTDRFDDSLTLMDGTVVLLDEADYFLRRLNVSASDYMFWETSTLSSRSSSSMGDFPVSYQLDLAMIRYTTWQNYVRTARSTLRLKHYLPGKLDDILAILAGEFPSDIYFESWAERLCAELLYRQPDILPSNIHRRTRKVVKDTTSGLFKDHKVDAVISIMEGDAGSAIHSFYHLGGGSGAALPATIVALMYNLFVEATLVPAEMSHRRIDYLCEAAAAIVSSLASSHRDMGVQLAVRLLLPYASDREFDYQVVLATISDILERYAPSTEQYARTILSICRPLCEMKSLQVLDGCVNVIIHVYRSCMKNDDAELGIKFLLDGIKLESSVLPCQHGRARQVLAVEARKLVLSLLQTVVGDTESPLFQFSLAKTIVGVVDSSSLEPHLVAEVKELDLVLSLFNAVASGDNQKIAKAIISCLEDRFDAHEKVSMLATPRSMHWELLKFAIRALPLKAKVEDEKNALREPTACFDKHEMTLLMQRFTELTTLPLWKESMGVSDDQLRFMKEALAHGLSLAFVAENAKRRTTTTSSAGVDNILSVNLVNYDRATQKRVIERMLDF